MSNANETQHFRPDPDSPPATVTDDKVGYGHPPAKSRFQPGRSGNPKGRPKGSKNLTTLWQDELNQSVTVTERGKSKKITKREALVKQQINNSLTGDAKAATLVVAQMNRLEAADETGPKIDLSALQRPELIAGIVDRIRQNIPARLDLPEGASDPERNPSSQSDQ